MGSAGAGLTPTVANGSIGLAGGIEREQPELGLNPRFEEHILDLNNWSLGPAFARQYPALVEGVKIREPGHRSKGKDNVVVVGEGGKRS